MRSIAGYNYLNFKIQLVNNGSIADKTKIFS